MKAIFFLSLILACLFISMKVYADHAQVIVGESSIEKIEELLANKDLRKAFNMSKNLIAQDKSNPQYVFYHAKILRLMRLYDESLQNYKKLAQLSPDDIRAYMGQGLIYLQQSDFERARVILEDTIERFPKNAGAHVQLANVYIQQQHQKKAMDELRLAVQLDPEHSVAYMNLANLYSKQGEYGHAIRNYKNCINNDRYNYAAYLYLATAYKRLDQVDDAVKTYRSLQRIWRSLGKDTEADALDKEIAATLKKR